MTVVGLPGRAAAVLISSLLLAPLLVGLQPAGAADSLDGRSREQARSSEYDDDFNGTSLDPKWSWLNPPDAFDVGNTTPGWLHVVSANNTNFGPSATSGTFLYQNMSGNITLETKLNATPASGVEKTGLLLYNSDLNWMALKYQVDGGGPYVEVGVQTPSSFGNLYYTAVTANPVWLRLVKDGLTITTFYSTDGENWTEQFNYTQSFDDPFMAGLLVSDGYSGTGFFADFDYFRYSIPNRVPELLSPFGPVTFNEDERCAIGAFEHFRDPDGDSLAFKAQAPHIKGAFNPAINDFELFGPPNWFGSENVLLTVTDTAGRSVQAALNVTVLPVEDAPVLLQALPGVMVLQNATNSTLNLSKHFSDNDTKPAGDVLTYSYYNNGPLQVAIAPGGRVTLAAPIDFWGAVEMTFTASDRAQNAASGACTVTVVHVNQAPQVVRPEIPDLMVNEDDAIVWNFSPVFWDPDGDAVTLVPSGNERIEVAAAPETLNVTFRPGPDASGFTETIAITAQDRWGLGTNWVPVRVTVTPVNDAPRITKFGPPGETVIKENQSQRYNITVYDPENGKAVNTSWFLDGALVDTAVFDYVYTPGFQSAGLHRITVTVTDGELSVSRSWNVTVENLNREPYNLRILEPRPGGDYEAGQAFALLGSAVDLDNDELSYTWFDGSKRLGEGKNLTLGLGAGVHVIYLVVTDGIADVESGTVTFTVRGNAAPRLYSLDPGNGQRFERGTPVHFKAEAEDPDRDMLVYCWTENGKVVSTSAEFFLYDLPIGTHRLHLAISDGRQTIETSVTIEVTAPAAGGLAVGTDVALSVVAVALVAVAAAALVLWRRKRPPGMPAAVVGVS